MHFSRYRWGTCVLIACLLGATIPADAFSVTPTRAAVQDIAEQALIPLSYDSRRMDPKLTSHLTEAASNDLRPTRRAVTGTLLGVFGWGAIASLPAQEQSAQPVVDYTRVARAIQLALLLLPPSGLAGLKEPAFWQRLGLNSAEQTTAIQISTADVLETQRRLQAIHAPPLEERIIASIVSLRMNATSFATVAKNDPTKQLDILIKYAFTLVETDYALTRSWEQKPTELLTADLLESWFTNPTWADAWQRVLRQLAPSQSTPNAQTDPAFTRLADLCYNAGYLLLYSIDPLSSGVANIIFNVSRRIPGMTSMQTLDGVRIRTEHYEPLGTELFHAVTVFGIGVEPFIALMHDPISAQMYVQARDSQGSVIVPNQWKTPLVQAIFRQSFGTADAKVVESRLEQEYLWHELFHAWWAAKRPGIAPTKQRLGLNDDEFASLQQRMDGKDAVHDARRIATELTAYTGALAFSDMPLFQLWEASQLAKEKRSQSIEALTTDYLLRSVVGIVSRSLTGSARRLGIALAEQTTEVTQTQADAWFVALLDEYEDPAALDDHIREAARTVFHNTFVTADGQPAQLPEKPRALALLSPRPNTTRRAT